MDFGRYLRTLCGIRRDILNGEQATLLTRRLASVSRTPMFGDQSRQLMMHRLHPALSSQKVHNTLYEATNFRYLMRRPYVIDMCLHHVDLIRALTGQNVVDVSAKSWRAPDSPYRHDPAMAALLTLDSGAPVAYEGGGATYRPWTSWKVTGS